MRQWAENQLKKTVSVLAGSIALIVTLVLPISYFYIQHQHLSTTLQHAANIMADEISIYAFQHPQTWSYQESRLIGFLEKNTQISKERSSLISKQHALNISTGVIEQGPVMVRQAPVSDGADTVAQVELQTSLYPLITNTTLVLLSSIILGLMIFATLYHWPLKALQLALSRLDEAHGKLEIEISEKQALLQQADDLTKKLHNMAMHDSLTGLANRTLYFDRLNHSMHLAERKGYKIAVVMIDLDKFKPINDELGHHIGDQLLINISHRLRDTLRKSDTIARLGGDEFALVLHVNSADDCDRLCQKLFDLIKTPIHLGRHTLSIEASFGIAIYPEHDTDPDLLLQKADSAMYAAKKAHSKITIYSSPN